MKKFSALLVPIIMLSQPIYASESPVISRIELQKCEDIQFGGSEFLSSAILTAFTTAAVKEAVVLGQKWFKEFKDGYKGADITENIVSFECNHGAGLNTEIVYRRAAGDDLHIELISSLTYSKTEKAVFFELSPKSLQYTKPIAKRGKSKDITFTYNFTFFDEDGKETKSTAGPILIRGIREGQFIQNLDTLYGSKALIKMPKEAAFSNNKGIKRRLAKISVEIAEASHGKGEELLGNVMKSVGETTEKNQDAIISAILAKIIDDNKDDGSGESSSSKPATGGGTVVTGAN